MNPQPPPKVEGKTDAERFQNALKRVLSAGNPHPKSNQKEPKK